MSNKKKIGLLCKSQGHSGSSVSVNACLDSILCTAEPFAMKLCMVMHHNSGNGTWKRLCFAIFKVSATITAHNHKGLFVLGRPRGAGDILLLKVADLALHCCHFFHGSGESPEQHGPHSTVSLHGERRCGWYPQTSACRSKPHAEGVCVGNQETQEVGACVFTVSRSVPSFQWHCWHQRSSSVVLMCPEWAPSVSLLCSSPQLSFFKTFALVVNAGELKT